MICWDRGTYGQRCQGFINTFPTRTMYPCSLTFIVLSYGDLENMSSASKHYRFSWHCRLHNKVSLVWMILSQQGQVSYFSSKFNFQGPLNYDTGLINSVAPSSACSSGNPEYVGLMLQLGIVLSWKLAMKHFLVYLPSLLFPPLQEWQLSVTGYITA